MRLSFPLLFTALIGSAFGSVVPAAEVLVARQVQSSSTGSRTSTPSSTSTRVADSACTNGPFTRHCWSDGFSIATDFDVKFPTTGKTVKKTLTITNTTLAPDGYERIVLAINGQYPGPTIIADWGDMLEITVINAMQDNGTSIHWHGIRQFHTNTEDGVPGITECPIAPGQSKTYRFQATQFGTTWYHSHFSGQYGEGVVGTIIINGPASSNYDVDLGTYTINDWYYTPTYTLAWRSQFSLGSPPPPGDNGLINGSMVSTFGGKYTRNTITKDKKYRLRLINTSVDNHFMVSLDGHPFTVISSDFVPIRPYTTNWLFLAIGQRYDVIINATQPIDNYWFRAEAQAGCGTNNNNGNIKSIFSYAGASSGNPTSSPTTYTARCTDETGVVPFWDSFVPSGPLVEYTKTLTAAINVSVTVDGPIVQWGLNLSSFDLEWEKPILEYVRTNNDSWPRRANLIEMPQAGQWYYWIIQEVPGAINGTPVVINVPHPIHLHGHDFYVLGTGIGQYGQNVDASKLNYVNPTRRDVAMLPAGGWLAMAFQADNPGAWLMHCHIAWHAGEGLAAQFLESKDLIQSVNPITNQFTDTCQKWGAYYPTAAYKKFDSGI
ncbi:multicopper oxidase [Phlyctema vagabunda]|uniref:laccase n=1 Tax=Phlyctema vagabunda TaxID=108571 RepID=A0ABR4PCM3_9HELO